jgi:hypothetical protein
MTEMRARFLILLLGVSILSALATAQQPPRIDPGSLRVLPENSIRDALAVRADFGDSATLTQATAATTTLPLFGYSVADGSGTIVGTVPTDSNTTTVPTIIVPVAINITQGGRTFSFNPNTADSACTGSGNSATTLVNDSPFFNAVPVSFNGVSEGTVQYIDAFQRAEFQTTVNAGHHTDLSPTIGATLTVSINARKSGTTTAAVFSVGGCGNGVIGVVNINTLNAQFTNYITVHGINASQFPLFVLYNAVMSSGAANNLNNCCILGFHNALGNSPTAPGQTYGVADFQGNGAVFTGVSDTAVLAHEIGEWANDPSGFNSVNPAWGGIGQVGSCQNNFEIGDPLSGNEAPAISFNGFTYHFQELAFFSWFYRDSPSQGAGGVYSSNGTFKGFAKACPPGGTN